MRVRAPEYSINSLMNDNYTIPAAARHAQCALSLTIDREGDRGEMIKSKVAALQRGELVELWQFQKSVVVGAVAMSVRQAGSGNNPQGEKRDLRSVDPIDDHLVD